MNPQLQKMQGISRLCNKLPVSEEEFCSMELVSYYCSYSVEDFQDTMYLDVYTSIKAQYLLACCTDWAELAEDCK